MTACVSALSRRLRCCGAQNERQVVDKVVKAMGSTDADVRVAAEGVHLAMGDAASLGPVVLLQKSLQFFMHRVANVRAGLCRTATALLADDAAAAALVALPLRRLVDEITSLVGDTARPVREATVALLAGMYVRCGEPLAWSLQGRGELSPEQLAATLAAIQAHSPQAERLLFDPKNPDPQPPVLEAAPSKAAPASPRGVKQVKTSAGGTMRSARRPAARGKAPAKETDWSALGLVADEGMGAWMPPAGLKATPPANDRDLADQLAQIHDIIKDTATEWNIRQKQLVRLQSLLAGGAATMPSFLGDAGMVLLQDGIALQMNDLRSALSREACTILCFAARLLTTEFSRFADIFIPQLAQRTFITVKIIRDTSHEANMVMFRNCRPHNALRAVMKELLSSKNNSLRDHCAEYLLIVLQMWETLALGKHAAVLDKALLSCVQDASMTARTTGREAYARYATLFPARAQALLKKMNPQAQKACEKLLGGGSSAGGASLPRPALRAVVAVATDTCVCALFLHSRELRALGWGAEEGDGLSAFSPGPAAPGLWPRRLRQPDAGVGWGQARARRRPGRSAASARARGLDAVSTVNGRCTAARAVAQHVGAGGRRGGGGSGAGVLLPHGRLQRARLRRGGRVADARVRIQLADGGVR